MPVYTYECEDCGKFFDVSGTYEFLENYKPICPKCWKENIRKVISAPAAIIYKGKGFYKTDSEEE